jgi:cyclophilin family peptidyl-prolyl cis-trans isomerase
MSNNLDSNQSESLDLNTNNNPIVVIQTSKGNIELELYKDKAPITVNNFLEYVNTDFYKNTVFHRVIKGFMIQGGGFLESGVKKDTNDPILLETTNNTNLSNDVGTISMARTMDPNSATSQFFINTVNNVSLDYSSEESPGYAVFGKVIKGMDVVENIENTQTTTKYQIYNDWPVEDIVIENIYIK